MQRSPRAAAREANTKVSHLCCDAGCGCAALERELQASAKLEDGQRLFEEPHVKAHGRPADGV